MKIKFNSNDNLPLNKPLKFGNMTITIRSVFEEDGKIYLQLFQMILCMNQTHKNKSDNAFYDFFCNI